jgi:hypothetical protein
MLEAGIGFWGESLKSSAIIGAHQNGPPVPEGPRSDFFGGPDPNS